MTIAFHDDTKRKLPGFAIDIITRNHKLEFILYLKAMKLISALNERRQSTYLSLPSIRRTLSSMTIDRTMARFLLRDLCECGFISHVPGHGYMLSPAIIDLQSFPYRPEHAKNPA